MAVPRGSSNLHGKANARKEHSIKTLVQKVAEANDENEVLSQAVQDMQAEQTKYEARIVGLQRAKQEAVAKAEAQCQKAAGLQQELEKLTVEKTRWQSQERAQLLKVKKLRDRQGEMEDALIDLKRDADDSANAAEQAQLELAELLNRLRMKNAELAAAGAAREDAVRRAREAEERSHQSHSEQSGAFDEERALLEGRVAFLEDNLAASQAFAAAAAEQAPAACGEECRRKAHEIERLRQELQMLLQRYQQQQRALEVAQQEQAEVQLQQQREGEAAAAATLQEGSRQAREHSQQAMRWVHRLRAEVLETEQALQRAHAGKLELVQEKLRLAEALCRATDVLAADRRGAASMAADQAQEEAKVAGTEKKNCQAADAELQAQLADANAAERAMLQRLECEIRRVIELERLRIADLRDNQEIHERLEAEVLTAWGLREALAEHKMDSRQ